jgi:hypothetical protein
MATKRTLWKVVDEVSRVRCASGPGVIREEVWQDAAGEVSRYNLAFINHFMMREDNGRVLGYDNGHGYHHRQRCFVNDLFARCGSCGRSCHEVDDTGGWIRGMGRAGP